MSDDAVNSHAIGEWIFLPSENLLSHGEVRKRLEHRTARTLELLCRRRGTIVAQAEIVEEIWQGRAISPNSVPVVIGDLRRALDDDARRPRHIETVAKRGYRLLAAPAEPIPLQPRRLSWPAGLLLLAALLALWLALGQSPLPTVAVGEVVNATGNPAYDPLARASSEVLLANLQKLEELKVVRGANPPSAARLGARLVMWSGEPTVMMTAQDRQGVILWTGKAAGENRMPREIRSAVATLPSSLRAADRK